MESMPEVQVQNKVILFYFKNKVNYAFFQRENSSF